MDVSIVTTTPYYLQNQQGRRLNESFGFYSKLGASVMMPIILTILGLLLGAKFGKAIRSGLTVGIGFIGLNLVIGMLSDNRPCSTTNG